MCCFSDRLLLFFLEVVISKSQKVIVSGLYSIGEYKHKYIQVQALCIGKYVLSLKLECKRLNQQES